jgi:diguanylate cyclase
MLEEADTYESKKRTVLIAPNSERDLVRGECGSPSGRDRAQDLAERQTLLLQTLSELHRDANKSELEDMSLEHLLARIQKIANCAEAQIASVSGCASSGMRILVLAATSRFQRGAVDGFGAGESERRDAPELTGHPLDLNSIVGAVIRVSGVVVSEDVATDPRADAVDRQFLASANFLGLPLMGTNGVVGVLSLASLPAGTDQDAAQLLEPLCLALGALLDRKQERLLADQLRAECSQAQSEFVVLAQTVEEVVAITDNQGVVRFMNSFAQRTFGVTSADLGSKFGLKRLFGSDFEDFGSLYAQPHGSLVPPPGYAEREWQIAVPRRGGDLSLRMRSRVLRDKFGNQNGVLHVGTPPSGESAAARSRRKIERVQYQLDEMTLREGELRLLTEMFSYVMVADNVRAALAVVAAYAPRLLSDGSVVLHRIRSDSARSTIEAKTEDFGDSVAATDCWAVRTGRIHLNLPERATRCSHAGTSAPSICAPLLDGEKVLAVLTIDVSADAAEQLAKRVSFVEGMIFQMTLALNNLRLRLSLSDQALTDPLTAVGNRRRAAEALDAAYGACLEDKQSFALLMADIDLFKQVNDTFGHDVGDRVLKQVASTLTASIRESDVVARVGGEEFLIVLRNISAADAESVAEQIRSRVELCEGENLPKCTISIGLLHVADCFTDLEALTPLVDSALYRAKSTGRNRVSVVPNSATDSKLRNAAAETVDSAGPGELKGKSVAP